MGDGLLTTNRFIVVLGNNQYSFSKVTNIADKIDLEMVEEGGWNASPRLLVRPKNHVETLVLERGVPKTQAALDASIDLKVGVRIYMGIIMVLDGKKVAKAYGFEEGIITKWEAGELDAVGKTIWIEKLELSHTGLDKVDDFSRYFDHAVQMR